MSSETVNNTDNWNISCNAVGTKWSKQGYQQAAVVSGSTHIEQKCLHKTNFSYVFHLLLTTVITGDSFPKTVQTLGNDW